MNKPLEVLPILQKIVQQSNLFSLGDELQLTVLEGPTTSLPEYFQTAVYALNLHVQGRLTASINHQIYEVEAPCFSSRVEILFYFPHPIQTKRGVQWTPLFF